MSKITLKKELHKMSKEQITEILLSAYSANKETKEYLDFFINPCPDELLEKYRTNIFKEFARVKHGSRSKARISVVKKTLKKFNSFEPGVDYVLELYVYTIATAITAERRLYFSTIIYKGILKIIEDTLDFSNKEGEFTETFNRIASLLDEGKGTKYFISLIRETLNAYINNPKKNVGFIK